MQTQRIHDLPVGEVMNSDVVTLKPTDLMSDAASTFIRAQISGAPVVYDDGKCAGVISVTDIVNAVDKSTAINARLADEFFGQANLILPSNVYEGRLTEIRDQLAPVADQPVSIFMMTDVVTVKESDDLKVAMRRLVDSHIHRLIVVDEEDRLQGIVSTIDVLDAILRDAD